MTNEVSFDFEANLEQVPAVQSNLAELEAFVQQVKDGYIAQPVTIATVAAAKKDLATFRKVEKAIDDKVKGIRRQLLAPYEEYKAKVDQICAVLKTLEAELAGNITAVEQEMADAKKKEVENLLRQINLELPTSVAISISNFWQDAWLNKTTTLKKVEEQYRQVASEAEATLDAIKGNPHEAQLLSVFKTYYSYARVSQRMRELAEEDRRLAELKAHQEEERKREEEAAARAMTVPTFTAPTAPATPEPEPQKEPEKVVAAAFKIVGTIDQIAAAVNAAKQLGVGIKRISMVHTATDEDKQETSYRGEKA